MKKTSLRLWCEVKHPQSLSAHSGAPSAVWLKTTSRITSMPWRWSSPWCKGCWKCFKNTMENYESEHVRLKKGKSWKTIYEASILGEKHLHLWDISAVILHCRTGIWSPYGEPSIEPWFWIQQWQHQSDLLSNNCAKDMKRTAFIWHDVNAHLCKVPSWKKRFFASSHFYASTGIVYQMDDRIYKFILI